MDLNFKMFCLKKNIAYHNKRVIIAQFKFID